MFISLLVLVSGGGQSDCAPSCPRAHPLVQEGRQPEAHPALGPCRLQETELHENSSSSSPCVVLARAEPRATVREAGGHMPTEVQGPGPVTKEERKNRHWRQLAVSFLQVVICFER